MNLPVCPKCGASLALRTRKSDGREFFGCSRWPECKFTELLPAYFEMKKRGAPILPGFEEVSK